MSESDASIIADLLSSAGVADAGETTGEIAYGSDGRCVLYPAVTSLDLSTTTHDDSITTTGYFNFTTRRPISLRCFGQLGALHRRAREIPQCPKVSAAPPSAVPALVGRSRLTGPLYEELDLAGASNNVFNFYGQSNCYQMDEMHGTSSSHLGIVDKVKPLPLG